MIVMKNLLRFQIHPLRSLALVLMAVVAVVALTLFVATVCLATVMLLLLFVCHLFQRALVTAARQFFSAGTVE